MKNSKLINPSRSTYHSSIYREFRSLDASDWHTVLRFYELYEEKIAGLEFEESFDMLLAYGDALFEVGDYPRHLVIADQILEASVMNNIKFFNGEDVFQKTLFKKAASNYRLYELEKCDYLLRELLRIDPYDRHGAMFLKKCLRDMKSSGLKKARAFSVSLLLISAIIICFELVAVDSFYPELADTISRFRNITLVMAFVVLVGGELFHRLYCHQEVDQFVARLRRRKK